MSYLANKQYIKVISILLVLSLLWQGVVWAYPDITTSAKLQAQSSLTSPHRSEFLKKSALKFLKNYLLVAELDLANGNLLSIKECINEAIDQLRGIKDMPKDFLDSLRPDDAYENTGYIIVDAGDCLIKYYTPKKTGAATFPEGYRIKGEERSVSRYLCRQVLVKEGTSGYAKDYRGFMARGDYYALYEEFKKQNPVLSPLRPSLNHKRNSRPGIAVDLLRRLEENKAKLYGEEMALIAGAIAKFAEARLVEFVPPVLTDPDDPIKPEAWLFGFNTVELPPKARFRNTYNRFSDTLRAEHPDTIGFATPVLDLVQADKPILHEYILHELICPYFGHGRAREIQELLFGENYSGIVGDKSSAHMDGQLSFAIRRIILERCDPIPEEHLAQALIKTDLTEFRKYDFTERGPQNAARFEGPFRRHYERARKAWLTEQLRSGKVSRVRFRKVLDDLDRIYAYTRAKTEWIWSTKIEALWEKMDRALKEEDNMKARHFAKEILEKHYSFMSDRRNALLKSDRTVKVAIERIRAFLSTGSFKKHLRAKSSAHVVAEKKEREESSLPVKEEKEETVREGKPKYTGYPGGILRWITDMGWVWYLAICLVALPVAFILAIFMPVSPLTVFLAVVIPLAVFVTMLVINWSWKNLFVALAFSALISYFLPVPWYGLALATVVIGMALWNRRVLRSRAGKGIVLAGRKAGKKDKKEQDKHSGEFAGDAKKGEESPKEDEETRTARILERVNVSPDILQYVASINALLLKDAKNTDPESITTQDVLDVLFREEPIELIEGDKKLQDELRPRVFYKLKEIEEMNTQFELNIAIASLRNWDQLTDAELACAFQEIVNEIANEVSSWKGGSKDTEEMIAIQDLVGEYYGIPEKRMNHIRLHMLLQRAHEQLDEDRLVGVESVDTYYMVGRVEFYFQHYKEAGEAFEKCIEKEPFNTDFHFVLGLTRHCMKKWPDAEESYRRSLNIRKNMSDPTEVDKLKRKLTELLIKKIGQRVPIEGKEKKSPFKYPEDKNSQASIEFLKDRLFPGLQENEYSLLFGPAFEESLFFLAPALASQFILGLDVLGMIAVMAVSRAVFFFMHKGARPNAPPSQYTVPAFVAVAGFLVSLIPLLFSSAYYTSPLMVIALLSFISYQIHFFANIFASQKKIKPAAIKENMPQDVRIGVLGVDVKETEKAIKGIEEIYRQLGWEEYEGHVRDYIKQPNRKIYLAMKDEKVIGFLVSRRDTYSWGEENPPKKPVVYISSLGVSPTFSGRGIGTLLLERVSDDNIKEVDRIQVISEPSAVGFYRTFAERKGYMFRSFYRKGPQGEEKYYVFFRDGSVSVQEEENTKVDYITNTASTPEEIGRNAEKVVPVLVQALIDVAAKRKGKKIILALDTELGEGRTNQLVKKLIRIFSEIKTNNSDLATFLKDLEIVRGEGRDLAEKIRLRTSVSGRKKVEEEMIVITKNANLVYFNNIEGKASITAVDDGDLPDTSYLPLFEVVLFSLGRYLGWKQDTLENYYNMIPNAVPLSQMRQEDYYDLLNGGNSITVIKLLPGAEKFTETKMREVFDNLKTILAGA